MVRDERRRPRIFLGQRSDSPRPDALANFRARADEVRDLTGLGVDRGLRVLDGPAVVVRLDLQVPVLRELLTWNCVVRLRKRT